MVYKADRDLRQNERGFINVLAILLALAITFALSSLFVQVSHTIYISAANAPNNTVASYVLHVTPNAIEVKNPYPLSLSLSKIKVYINDKPMHIYIKEEGNIWRPGTTLVIPINMNESILRVKVIVNSQLIYSGLFIKPTKISIDRTYPTLHVSKTKSAAGVTLSVQASDNILLKKVSLLFYDVHGHRLSKALVYKPDAKKCMWCASGHISTALPDVTVAMRRNTTKLLDMQVTFSPNQLGVAYTIVKAMDEAGHVSQKVILYNISAPSMRVSLLNTGGYYISGNTIYTATTPIQPQLRVEVYYSNISKVTSVTYKLNGVVYNITQQVLPHSGDITLPPLSAGTYNIIFTASTDTGIKTRQPFIFTIVKANAPVVQIISPTNYESFTISDNQVTVPIKATVSSEVGLTSVVAISASNTVVLSKDPSGYWVGTLVIPTSTTTTATITVKATDILGQTGQSSVTIDIVSPIPTQTPTPTPTNTPTPVVTPTPTPVNTPTPTPTPVPTPKPTVTPITSVPTPNQKRSPTTTPTPSVNQPTTNPVVYAPIQAPKIIPKPPKIISVNIPSINWRYVYSSGSGTPTAGGVV